MTSTKVEVLFWRYFALTRTYFEYLTCHDPAFLWGTTYAVTKYATPDWPPLLLGALRALPAGLLLLLLKPSLPTRSTVAKFIDLRRCEYCAVFCVYFYYGSESSCCHCWGRDGVCACCGFVICLAYERAAPCRSSILRYDAGGTMAWLLFDPAHVALNVLGVAALFGALLTIVIGSTLVQSLSVHIHWWVVLTWQLIIGGTILLLAAFIDGSLFTLRAIPSGI